MGHVGVVGLGFVGLRLAVHLADQGYRVAGVDINARHLTALERGVDTGHGLPPARIRKLLTEGALSLHAHYRPLRDVAAVCICVPSPLTPQREPDLACLTAAAGELGRHLSRGQLVILESSTYPGTTEELLLPILEETGMRVGRDFFLAHAPERLDPGHPEYDIRSTPRIVGGVTLACLDRAVAFYRSFVDDVVAVSSPRLAEMAKILENTYRCVNIALVNEFALLCDRMDLDIWEVIDAAATKPYGFAAFYPGPGPGGHCIPVDPYYLTWKAREYGVALTLVEAAWNVNQQMPYHIVDKVTRALAEDGKALRGAHVLVLGITYKRDVADARNSTALKVIEILMARGAKVSYNDPHVPDANVGGARLVSQPLSDAAVATADCVVVTTPHSVYDLPAILGPARLVVDTRNATRGLPLPRVVYL